MPLKASGAGHPERDSHAPHTLDSHCPDLPGGPIWFDYLMDFKNTGEPLPRSEDAEMSKSTRNLAL